MIWLDEPTVSNIGTELADTDPFPAGTLGKAVRTESQDSIVIGWEKPNEEQNIYSICRCNWCEIRFTNKSLVPIIFLNIYGNIFTN